MIYSDEYNLRIFRGTDGAVLFETPIGSVTGTELPVVVDVDNDNNAEIVVVSNNSYFNGPKKGIQVFGDAGDTWVNTRKIWNQHAYSITNVNDDGTIPQHPDNNWDIYNNFRQNQILDPFGCIDLTSSYLRIEPWVCPNSVKLIARIGNGGVLHTAPGIPIAFYAGDPDLGGIFLGTTQTTGTLLSGQYEDVEFVWENFERGLTKIYVVADSDGAGNSMVSEIDESNNKTGAFVNVSCNHRPVADAGEDITVPLSGTGKLVVSSDEYPMSELAFDRFPESTTRFVQNIAAYFTGGGPGNFLLYSSDDTSYSQSFINAITDAGHTITQTLEPESLTEYDGIFTGGNLVDLTALHEYIASGGNIYIVGGTANFFNEHVYWNDFLNLFGLDFGPYPGTCGNTISIFEKVPIFHQVSELYECNGNTIEIMPGDWPYTRIVSRQFDLNWWAIYDPEAQLYGGGSTDADNDSLFFQWTIVSAPDGSAAFLKESTAVSPILQADMPGTYELALVVSDYESDSTPDSVIVSVLDYPVNRNPLITSTPQTSAILSQPYTYDTEAIDPDGETMTYSLAVSPDGMIINPETGLTEWTPNAEGDYQVKVVVVDEKDGICTQSFSIAVYEDNRPPEIISMPPFYAVVNMLYKYEVDAFDLDDDPLIYALVSTPEGMIINAETGLISWTPEVEGSYEISLSAEDSNGGSATQTYALFVSQTPNGPPEITSTPVVEALIDMLYDYQVEATDPENDLIHFSLFQAPAGMTIDSESGLIWWSPGIAQTGEHTVVVKVKDNRGNSVVQIYTITVSQYEDQTPPEIALNVHPLAAEPGQEITITVVATDNEGVTSLGLTVDGEAIPLDAFGQAVFSSEISGLFMAEAFAGDAARNITAQSRQFRVLVPGDTTPPVVNIITPEGDSELTAPTQIIGTASDDNLAEYRLEYSSRGKGLFTVFAEGADSVTEDTLGEFDTTLLLNGLYDIRLTAEDINGNISTITSVYRVKENLKIGNFTVTFEDLSIPVSGIPIIVTRIYDSRDKESHDFGFGWTLGVANVRVEESCLFGDKWRQFSTGGLWPTYYLEPVQEHYVTVTLPDGRTEEFTMALEPQVQSFIPIQATSARFIPRPGTFSSLEAVSDNYLMVIGGVGIVELYKSFTNPVLYDPVQYRLTTREGIVYELDERFGVIKVTDRNGNTLTFERNGIIHSAGKSIEFLRDAEGRITRITDPAGNTIDYEYNANGDLVGVADEEGNVTRFTYNSSHGLLDIIDPRGITPSRNEYDTEGRLISQTDANGNRIEFSHNIGARQEIVTDRLGNTSGFEYDERGNIISKTDALGNTTTYTYDVNGNRTSKTDPLGNITVYIYDESNNLLSVSDPLGNTTSYTYNASGQMLTETDPLGQTTAYVYDLNGNLLKHTDQAGSVKRFNYDSQGNRISEIDPLGNTSLFFHNGDGNLIREVNPFGQELVYI